MKAGFPLPAAEKAKVLEALRLPPPSQPSASDTLDQFIDEFAKPGGAIRAVTVHKRRTRYTVGGCMAELSDVVANGKPTRTIAVESEDAAAVIRRRARPRPRRVYQHLLPARPGGAPRRRRRHALR